MPSAAALYRAAATVEVSTSDGARWRLEQPTGRDFAEWQGISLLIVRSLVDRLHGTADAALLELPESPEKWTKIEAAAARIAQSEAPADRATLTDQIDHQGALIVGAAVREVYPPDGQAWEAVHVLPPGHAADPARGEIAWSWLPPVVRHELSRAAREFVRGGELRRQLDRFRAGAAAAPAPGPDREALRSPPTPAPGADSGGAEL